MAAHMIPVPMDIDPCVHRVVLTEKMLSRGKEIQTWVRSEDASGMFYESSWSPNGVGVTWLAFSDERTANRFVELFT